VYVGFDGDLLSFSGICNSMSLEYALEQGRVIASVTDQTNVEGCSDEQTEQDDWLEDFFSSEPTLALDGPNLTVSRGAVRLMFLDDEVADPDRPLVGTMWQIEAWMEGCLVTNLGGETLPQLTFATDSTWQVRAECFEGTGRYAVQGDRIELMSTSYVKKECVPFGEQALVPELLRDGLIGYSIYKRDLNLMRQDAKQLVAKALEPTRSPP
jgi:heat shock protein HslJ